MVAKTYGKSYTLPFLREKCYIDKAGVSLKGISEAAELIGLRTLAVKVPNFGKRDEPSLSEAPTSTTLHWNQNHFVVMYKISRTHVWIADPADGNHQLTIEDFEKSWCSEGKNGIALLVEPSNEFYAQDLDEGEQKGFSFLFQYLRPHKKLMFQLIIGLLSGTVFQLIFPFLTQSFG
ncbi:MAG: ATP-binding cassette subfamily B protein [Halioglobus sp.]|jgi:ATP-binding cassette subfamily B protein